LIAAVLAAGCVHRPPLTSAERCATRGMVLAGLSMSSGSSVGYATTGRTQAWAVGASYDESVICRVPETEVELCEVAAFAAGASEKLGFGTFWRNTAIGLGYLTFVLPGFVLLVVFDGQQRATGRDAEQLSYARALTCRRPPPPRQDPGTTLDPFKGE
jgi:hypothetical protein